MTQDPPHRPARWGIHLGLFLACLGTTWLAGIGFAGGGPFEASTWQDASLLLRGATYTLGVMPIIFAHEMGHYVMARRHGVPVSLPYFLPGLPIPGMGVIPLMGTFGAFIRMGLRPMRAKQLLKIGAWGPLAGFLLTLPVLCLGYALSEVQPLPQDLSTRLFFGDTLLMLGCQKLFFPTMPAGHDVFLHPLAVAGWTGGFLTAFNLLPLGQLDGGHIGYSRFGSGFNRVVPWLFGALVIMGITAFAGWLVLAGLVWWMSPRHPDIVQGPPLKGGRDSWLFWASVAMFVLTFTPWPIHGPQTLWQMLLGLF